MSFGSLIAFYAVPLLVIWAVYLGRRKKAEFRSIETLNAASRAGLLEPASLHPEIDPVKCIGCAACVRACPEGDILGLINGKAVLIEPTQCIGHGACRMACPSDAITLVFGTETRGIDIPHVDPNFQTNIPGIFIAGELGGMGLIRNAIEQGRQAIESVRQLNGLGQPGILDVVIVGSGPAGISASLAAIQHRLRYLTIEQESFGGTVAHFPRGKLVMTSPATLPLIGKVKFGEISKGSLLAFWRKAARETGLKVRYRERLENVRQDASGFEVVTSHSVYRARAVLLAIGRRGTPRKLDVPGEDQPKVVYRMIDPAQYRGQQVLVVGGGDSALEAAASISEEPDTIVTLSHRSENFSRAKPKNRQQIDAAQKSLRLKVLYQSSVTSIGADTVEIEQSGNRRTFKNEAVIVCAGGILPTQLLKKVGIEIETKYGSI